MTEPEPQRKERVRFAILMVRVGIVIAIAGALLAVLGDRSLSTLVIVALGVIMAGIGYADRRDLIAP